MLDSVAVNGAGEVYVSGSTTATFFPGNGALNPHPAAGIVAKLSPDLGKLLYSRQVGREVNQLALFELAPSASQTHIYTIGAENTVSTDPSGDEIHFATLIDDLQLQRIRNYWKPDQFINIESRTPAAGIVGPGWLSAQWKLEEQLPIAGDPPNSPVFWIHNVWQPDASGEYLNIENGQLASTSIGPGWLSARWALEPVAGNGTLYRIRNVWKPDMYLNIESGALAAGQIGPGWLSAMWSFERVY